MKNVGKQFEDNFEKSVPKDCICHRLKDSAQSFTNYSSTHSLFSWNNPCDFFIFDTRKGVFHTLELKTTSSKSITFEDFNVEGRFTTSKMIKPHQVKGLLKFAEYENTVSGFLFNFRTDDSERTYFQNIKDFVRMCNNINKQSFNEIDLIMNKAYKLESIKKRVHYRYNIDKYLKEIGGENNE